MAASDHRNSWDRWYSTARWQRLRKHQLSEHPLCALCAEKGLVVPASIVDHIIPHKGNWDAFVLGKLQSLCKLCHDRDKRMIELRGYSVEIGTDGYPVDPRHPAYRPKVKP